MSIQTVATAAAAGRPRWLMPRLAGALVALATLACSAGCGQFIADVGYSAPIDASSAEGGAAIDLRANTGGIIGFGAAAHSTLASDLQTIAFSPELTLAFGTGDVSFGVRGGIRLIQFERYRGEWNISSLSPYGGPVIGFALSDPLWLFLSMTVEYDVRWRKNFDDVLYLGGQVGIGVNL